MAVVFAGVVGLVVGQAVDRDEGAVQDGVGQAGGLPDGGAQVVGEEGEQVEGFMDVASGGGGADAETACQTGVGVAVTQMR
ncbi:hypothetical protein GCM10022248_89340 [Nonomuraea soli]